jgi:hypothetical protein
MRSNGMTRMDCDHCWENENLRHVEFDKTCDHYNCNKNLCLHAVNSPTLGMSFCSREHFREIWDRDELPMEHVTETDSWVTQDEVKA